MRDFLRLSIGTLRCAAREFTVGRLTVQYGAPLHVVLWWADR